MMSTTKKNPRQALRNNQGITLYPVFQAFFEGAFLGQKMLPFAISAALTTDHAPQSDLASSVLAIVRFSSATSIFASAAH